ncbi:MAG: hypothetical protein KAS75_03575 [Planctomycetes bacterium]|nr:hypothetical protein [Planctomycetota bacterium]
MAIVAPLSKFKKNGLKIRVLICIAFAAWCVYDGYLNKEWAKKHTDPDGTPQTYLVFNRQAPFYLFPLATLFAANLFIIRNKKVVADENELIINGKERISYDSIEKIDKTNFDSKGFFIITCKNESGRETDRKISDKTYDNLGAIIDEVITKIS